MCQIEGFSFLLLAAMMEDKREEIKVLATANESQILVTVI